MIDAHLMDRPNVAQACLRHKRLTDARSEPAKSEGSYIPANIVPTGKVTMMWRWDENKRDFVKNNA